MPPIRRPPPLPDPADRQGRLARTRMPGARGGLSEQVTPVTPPPSYERIPVAGGALSWGQWSGDDTISLEEYDPDGLFHISSPADEFLHCDTPGTYLVNVVVEGVSNQGGLTYSVSNPGVFGTPTVGGLHVDLGEGQFTGGAAWGNALWFAQDDTLQVDIETGAAFNIRVTVLYLGSYEGTQEM